MKLILSILIISIPLDIFAQKKAMSISESSDELERVEKQLKDSKDPVGLLDEEIAEKAGGSKTSFDFGEMSIDGNYMAPTGFLITGKKNQALERMINLRKNFKKELKKSSMQLPALVK